MKKVLSLLAIIGLLFGIGSVFAQYGWWWWASATSKSSLTKDTCPDGDTSGSYYDGTCVDGDDITDPTDTSPSEDPEDEVGATIAGYIFDDDNSNNTFDTNEYGIQGAVVTLTAEGIVVDIDTTDANGYYIFYNVPPGDYKVHVSLPVNVSSSFWSDIARTLVPSVHAANEYEFDVTVEDGDVSVAHVPVDDGVIYINNVKIDNDNDDSDSDTSDAEDDASDTEDDTSDDDDSTPSLLDLFKNRGSVADQGISDLAGQSSGQDGFVLPGFLAPTGASI